MRNYLKFNDETEYFYNNLEDIENPENVVAINYDKNEEEDEVLNFTNFINIPSLKTWVLVSPEKLGIFLLEIIILKIENITRIFKIFRINRFK